MRLITIVIACLVSAIAATMAPAGTTKTKVADKPEAKIMQPSKVKGKTRKLCPNSHVWDVTTKMCEEIDNEM